MRILKAIFIAGRAFTLGVGALLLLTIGLGAVTWFAPSWTPIADQVFRDRDCIAGPIHLTGNENIDDALGDDWNCRGEQFTIGDAGQAFSVNFLEFLENGAAAGALGDNGLSAQLQSFRTVLDQDEKSYVIVFVHGWRNNAERYNNDLRKFRILLSYAASFVDQRCTDADSTYCGMKVRGLFVGWRGATFREWAPEPLASLFAASTFMARKVVTDGRPIENTMAEPKHLPVAVAIALRAVEAGLQLRDEEGVGNDRMLVIGHSLGGNLLLQGFKGDIIASIKPGNNGQIVPPPVGDLVVLVNPATAAADWIEMAQSVRDANSLRPVRRWESESHDFFSIRQPPVIMALTATCPFNDRRFDEWSSYWSEFFGQFGRAVTGSAKPRCDWVTGYALPLAQILLNDERAYGSVAAGQLVPTEPKEEGFREDQSWPPVLVGVTHGLELNDNTDGVETSMASSLLEPYNRCATAPGWLAAARLAAGEHHHYWEALTPVRRETDAIRELAVQFAHGGSLHGDDNRIRTDPITAGSDPLWNVAAHSNAIEEHGGYVSYQVWCAINQFVLDDTSNRYAVDG